MMRYALTILCLLDVIVPTFGKAYLGDTRLSSQRTDDITVMGVTSLDNIVARMISITGPLTANKITASQLSVTGPVKIDGGVFKKVSITGAVVLNHVTVDELKITGPVNADNLIVLESLDLIGSLNVQNSKLINVTLTMDESSFRDSKVTEIFIKRPSKKGEVQTLKLYGSPQISTVKFESGLGEIHVYGEGVTLGNVTGAKVIQHTK
jgi:hypothetical protein